MWSPQASLFEGANALPSLVLAFGDGQRGQLGYNHADAASRRGETLIRIVEELRGYNPVQVRGMQSMGLKHALILLAWECRVNKMCCSWRHSLQGETWGGLSLRKVEAAGAASLVVGARGEVHGLLQLRTESSEAVFRSANRWRL